MRKLLIGPLVEFQHLTTSHGGYYALTIGYEAQGILDRFSPGWLKDGRLRFELNQVGDFANWLIAEVCVNDPTFIRLGWWNTQVGRRECSSWIKLLRVNYAPPSW